MRIKNVCPECKSEFLQYNDQWECLSCSYKGDVLLTVSVDKVEVPGNHREYKKVEVPGNHREYKKIKVVTTALDFNSMESIEQWINRKSKRRMK